MRKDGRRSRKNLSGKLEFEWTPERPERLSGGSLLQVAGTARAEFRQGGDGGAAGGSGRRAHGRIRRDREAGSARKDGIWAGLLKNGR